MSRIHHKHVWGEKDKSAVVHQQVRSEQRGPEEEVSYDGSRITAVIGSFGGREGVQGLWGGTLPHHPQPPHRSHTHSHLASSPPVPENPPAECNPTQSPSQLCPPSIAAKENQWNIFPPKWRGTMDVKVFLIREFTQKALLFFSPFFSTSRLAEQSERGWKWGNNGWWVMKVTHFPLRRSLLSNINFITHNPGCQSTSDRLTSPAWLRPWLCAQYAAPEATSVFLPLSPSLMCHCVLSYLTLIMEVETLLYCCIIERPSDVLALGKSSR